MKMTQLVTAEKWKVELYLGLQLAKNTELNEFLTKKNL